MTAEHKKGDRGGGIHITRRSDFRIRNLSLSIDATTGEVTASPITTELRTDIFDDWLRIAERSAAESEAARLDALETPLQESEAFTTAVQREFEAAMMAVAASAFALDAFFASVIEHAPEARVTAKSRDGTIFETIKR